MKHTISQLKRQANTHLLSDHSSSSKMVGFRSIVTAVWVSCSVVAGVISVSSHAGSRGDVFIDYAKVTAVSPVYDTIEHRVPREECWNEQVQYTPHDQRYPSRRHARQQSSTPVILGALIGGALGNELGHHKRNKQVGTVVGAILGGSIGADVRNNKRGRDHNDGYRNGHHDYDVAYRNERRCKTHYEIESEQQLSGYDVEYRYHGHDYSTFTSEHPGKKLQVRVAVKPVQ